MKLQFGFEGTFSAVREQLNAVFRTVAGVPGSEALITREVIHHLVTECVDPAQERWLALRDPKAPEDRITVSARVEITFRREN